MGFRLEEELARPLTDWLEEDGFRVRREIPILGRRADLVGSREDAVAAVEMKLSDWREALRQAIAYQLAADRAWVAMPLAAASRAYRHRWQFEAQRVGLLAIDDSMRIRAPIPAGESPRLLPFLQRRIIDSWTSESWDAEVSRTEGSSAFGQSAPRWLRPRTFGSGPPDRTARSMESFTGRRRRPSRDSS